MLVRVLLAAIIAGVFSGLFATAVQAVRIVPLILEAEAFEKMQPDEKAGNASQEHSHNNARSVAHDHNNHGHASDAWAPEDGWQRSAATTIANILAGIAFALLIGAAMVLSGQAISPIIGLIWGLCGFFVFVLMPNFGLPPELPGMAAGDLAGRQIWWLASVVCSAVGLALLFFKRSAIWIGLALVLILLPHLYGAPQPGSHQSGVPAALAAEFVMATLVASLAFWLFLGTILGWILPRALRTGKSGKANA